MTLWQSECHFMNISHKKLNDGGHFHTCNDTGDVVERRIFQ
mgnify:CR=1 FL=1